MKKILAIFTIITLFSCSAKKNTASVNNGFCPEEGNCTVEVFKNKSMIVHEEGGLHYEMADSDSKNVIVYRYDKTSHLHMGDAVTDGDHREEIVFEIDKDFSDQQIINMQLQNTKMLFGRFCFCKGAAGYFKVTKGNLKIEKHKKRHKINLDFTINEVPQLINKVEIVL